MEQYFTVMMFGLQFYPVCHYFLENVPILDLAVLGEKGLSKQITAAFYFLSPSNFYNVSILVSCFPLKSWEKVK